MSKELIDFIYFIRKNTGLLDWSIEAILAEFYRSINSAQRENSNVSDNEIQEKNCSSCKWQHAKYEYKCESCCAGDDQYEFEQFD